VVCVRALLHCHDHLALIERIAPNEMAPFYVFPGGHVEFEETRTDALKRECEEELGFNVWVGSYFTSSHYTEPDGTQRVEYYYFVWLPYETVSLPAFQPRVEYHPVWKGTYTPRWIARPALSGLDLRPADVWRRLLHHL